MVPKAFIFFYCLLLSVVSAAQTDSLLSAYRLAASPEEKGNLAYKIVAGIPDSRPELYVAYAREGYAALKYIDIPAKAKLANTIAYYYHQRSIYDSALYYYNIALATAKKINSVKIINAVTGNIGEVYGLMGKYDLALRNQLRVLNSYEQQKDIDNVQRVSIAIGNTYYHKGDYKHALIYFNQVYPGLKDKATYRAAGLFNSMGLAYTELGDKSKAAQFLMKALAVHEANKDSLAISHAMNNLGKAAIADGDYPAAEKWFRQAISIALAAGNKELADEQMQNLAVVKAKNGNTAAAIKQFKASLANAKKTGDLRVQALALQSLYALYDTLKDYNTAYSYLREFQALSDTTHTATYQREIADAETRYETQKALRERDKMQYEGRQQAAARSRAEQEKNQAIGISIAALAALLLIFGLAWRIRTIQLRSREQQGYTRAIFEGEQAERIRIARDLHDSIGQMLSVIKMRLSSLGGQSQEKHAESTTISMQLLDKAITEVRTISHNLIPEELSFGIVRGLENLCNNINETGDAIVNLSISDEVRGHAFNQQFSLSLYRIIQEVLGNMMKHSGASVINIDMAEAAGIIILKMADNGKGFDTGTINTSNGLGWKNIFARVNLLNGNLDVRSERITGTRIEITIPQ